MVADATALHDTIIFIRDLISTNVSDPISASRSGNERFVMTAFPERDVKYPIITVQDSGITDVSLGMQTEQSAIATNIQIDIWAKDTRTRDTLYDSVYDTLRTNQIGAGGTREETLFDFRLINVNNLDEDGKEGIHRKMMEIQYTFFTTT